MEQPWSPAAAAAVTAAPAAGGSNATSTAAPSSRSPAPSAPAVRPRGAAESSGAGVDLRRGSVRLDLPAHAVGDELTLDAGDELQLACDGDGAGPLVWSAPAAADTSRAARIVALANARPTSPGPAHGVARRLLYASNATGNHVNLYCCARQPVYATLDNVTEVANTDLQKCVYLFVNDPALPIVESQSQIIVSTVEGQSVTVGCRPSSKNLPVVLKIRGTPKILTNWTFTPRRGFTKVAVKTDHELLLDCICENKKQRFYLIVRDAAKGVTRPWLDAPLLLRAGATLPLNCSILLPQTADADFTFKLHGIKMRKFVNGTQDRRGVKGSTLKWQEAEAQGVEATDNGEVCCEVRDHLKHVNQSCSPVQVLRAVGGAPQLRVHLDSRAPSPEWNQSGRNTTVKMDRGPASFYWFVRVAWEGDVLPIAEWRDPDGNGFTVDSSPKKSETRPKGRDKSDVLVYWEPPLKEMPASIPGVAHHSTLVLKVATARAEPGNYSVEVRLGRQRPAQAVALRATLVGAPFPHLLQGPQPPLPLVVTAGVDTAVVCVVRAEPPPLRLTWRWVFCNDSASGPAPASASAAAGAPRGPAGVPAAAACDDDARTEEITGADQRQPAPDTLQSTLTLRDPPAGRWLRCDAANLRGNGSSLPVRLALTAVPSRGPSPGLVGAVVGVLALICGVAATCVYITLRQKRERRRLHCAAGLQGLVAGEPGSLDPTLPADEQAELLPYEARWEFPREDLILGRQLGAGAFGVVMKAEARGIVDDEDISTVAVKMVKRGADDAYLRALASELKILVHLGRHLNVVNLLGACTGRIMERELLVIVEYCPYGNLHNYLLRHRDGFVDQVDPRTGRVDATRGAAQLAAAEAAARRARMLLSSGESGYSMGGSPQGSGESGLMTAVTYCPTGGNCTSGGSSYDSGGAAVPLSPLPTDDSSSSGGPQPLWRTLYRCDTRAPSRVLCTADLLSWAYQVACGMQYLAQRKVLHGDLAARNVLLARDGIVKICDFGLARSMYKSDTYKKKGDGPLPIKWMALESIRDRIFSTQSDVWSFGVVMWELFSLGATPYPGMQPSEEFYNKLLSGYRMEHPPYAPRTVYDLMSACWETDPRRRPTFETLASELGELLDNSTRERFERLIEYEQQKGGVGGECDYLAMLGSPDYGALTSPEEHVYVNTPQAMEGSRPMAPEPNTSTNPDPELSTDYLNMSRPSTPGTSQVSFY